MASKSELNLMTEILDLEGVKVIDYRLIEGIGIVLSLENTKKEILCEKCGKTTNRVHTNNYQLVRDLPLSKNTTYLKINRRQMRCPHC